MSPRGTSNQRNLVQLLVILTLLAWATQTLLSQWGFSAEPLAIPASGEKFVPRADFARPATIEFRADARVSAPEVRLSDIARWADADADALRQAADLIIARLDRASRSATIDIRQVKQTLADAGINLASIHFTGAITCTVTRIAAPPLPVRDSTPFQDASAITRPSASTVAPLLLQDAAPPPAELRTLRDILTHELSAHLTIPVESLQIRFNPQDERLLNLTEPHFRFDIEPSRVRKLGDISWNITLSSPAGEQKLSITANARAWQTQFLAARPIGFKQTFHDQDLIERRVLIDRFSDEPSLSRAQIVGQQAARDIPAGTILVPRMVEAVQVARVGQLVTVLVERGRIQVKWVGEARESGALGQTIRVRKPGTRDEFSVILTGHQEARLIAAARS